MISPPASVDRYSAGHWVRDLDPRSFGVVNADPGAGIRLELPSWRPKSQNEVKHKGGRINPSGHVALCNEITIRFPQREVGATPKAIVEPVALNCWTNNARAKDITELDSTIKPDVI